MTKPLLLVLVGVLWAASALAQTTITTTTANNTTTTTATQPLPALPPASACFICNCNNQDFSCRTACNTTDFAARQQCLAACASQQAQCLANAQAQQRAVDTKRQSMLGVSLTATPTPAVGTTMTTTVGP